jgi:PAS domain S-box-containing protein
MKPNLRHKILVADDDTRGLHFLKGLLSSEGYELSCACDGKEALALAEESVPDAILLDVMMPGMDGFEVCRRLRAHPVLNQVPIILLTALDDRESKLEGLEAGADDFLTKPFDATELLVRLRTITRLNRFHRLAEERARFEQIVAFSPDGIVLVEPDGRILLANREFARMASMDTEADCVGNNVYDWLIGEGNRLLEESISLALKSQRSKGCELLISGNPDHDPVPVELTASTIPWEGRQILQLVLHDVQERKRLEGQVMRYQRIELLGEMAGSIVHDMNNVLGAINSNMILLDMSEDLGPEAKGRIGTIQQSIQRGSGILRQLLSFTRGSDGEFNPVDLGEIAEEVLNLVQPMMKYHYQLEKDIAEGVPLIEADTNQLHQVLMNLCVNARDAMANGGTLRVSVFEKRLQAAEAARLSPEAREGRYSCLSVCDTGTGMTPEVRARIFAPFFTTKPPGKGTGLGLATVLRLVGRHRGFITVDSEVGKGTCFICHFPSSE